MAILRFPRSTLLLFVGWPKFCSEPSGAWTTYQVVFFWDACSGLHTGESAQGSRADSVRYRCLKKRLRVPGLRWHSWRCAGVSGSELSTRCWFRSHVHIPSMYLHLFSVSNRKLMRVYCACPTPYMVGAGWDGCFSWPKLDRKLLQSEDVIVFRFALGTYLARPTPHRNGGRLVGLCL